MTSTSAEEIINQIKALGTRTDIDLYQRKADPEYFKKICELGRIMSIVKTKKLWKGWGYTSMMRFRKDTGYTGPCVYQAMQVYHISRWLMEKYNIDYLDFIDIGKYKFYLLIPHFIRAKDREEVMNLILLARTYHAGKLYDLVNPRHQVSGTGICKVKIEEGNIIIRYGTLFCGMYKGMKSRPEDVHNKLVRYQIKEVID